MTSGTARRDAVRDERLARRGAAVLALVAGVLHLGQVRTHFDEDWTFAAFFIVVGLLQVFGGAYLARPVGPRRFVPAVATLGVVGSLATIGIWAVSRALGLPFGAEPGSRETVGLADAAAGLFELFTALLLLHWLAARRGPRPRAIAAASMVGAVALTALWRVTRAADVFDPDPRLVIAPGLTDATAVLFLLVMVALLASLALGPGDLPAVGSWSLLTSLLVGALAFTAATLPARGGQNRDCAYAPILDDSGLTHAKPSEELHLHPDETTSAIMLVLVACAGREIELVDVRPLRELSADGPLVIEDYTIERGRAARSAWFASRPGGPPARGALLRPGERYPLAVFVRARAPGNVQLAAFTLEYRDRGETGTITFATVLRFEVRDRH